MPLPEIKSDLMKTAIGFFYFGFVLQLLASRPEGWTGAPDIFAKAVMLFGAFLLAWEMIAIARRK